MFEGAAITCRILNEVVFVLTSNETSQSPARKRNTRKREGSIKNT